METWGIVVLVIVALLVIVVLSIVVWAIRTGNWFRQTKVKIDESKSSIDVALTKRYDLLTKSLATVKGYAKHESETLIKVIQMRNPQGVTGMNMQEKSDFAAQLDKASKEINIVLEKYPELKADTQFTMLQNQISDSEENLQAARRIFNSNISVYNQRVVTWPSSIIANHYGYIKEAFFEAEAEKRQDVKIEF
jgi:LemA protein